MNKVITINLNGIAYQIDEDGYHLLQDYLVSAEEQLGDNPDQDEIVTDLEEAIADKCRRFLEPNKDVISTEEVQTILEEMGPVESEATGSESDGKGKSRDRDSRQYERSSRERQGPKRLYRIEEGKMIGGVCNGLAVYFDVDVTVVRLIFAALALASGGIMVVAYFVMMFLVPEARTPEEQASAFGMPFNAQEVIDQVKSQINDFKENQAEWKQEWKKKWKAQERYWQRDGAGFGGIHPVAGFFLLFFAMIFGISLITSIIRTFAVGVFSPTQVGIFGPNQIGAPPWMVLVMFIVGINFLFWVIGGGRRRDGPSPLGSLVGGIVQIFLLLVIVGFTYNVFPFVRDIVNSVTIMIYRLFM